jgi:hypothetical protein
VVCFTAVWTGTKMHYVIFGSVFWVIRYRAYAGADGFRLMRGRMVVRHVREFVRFGGFGEGSSRQIYDLSLRGYSGSRNRPLRYLVVLIRARNNLEHLPSLE